jgi:hypothetical protein
MSSCHAHLDSAGPQSSDGRGRVPVGSVAQPELPIAIAPEAHPRPVGLLAEGVIISCHAQLDSAGLQSSDGRGRVPVGIVAQPELPKAIVPEAHPRPVGLLEEVVISSCHALRSSTCHAPPAARSSSKCAEPKGCAVHRGYHEREVGDSRHRQRHACFFANKPAVLSLAYLKVCLRAEIGRLRDYFPTNLSKRCRSAVREHTSSRSADHAVVAIHVAACTCCTTACDSPTDCRSNSRAREYEHDHECDSAMARDSMQFGQLLPYAMSMAHCTSGGGGLVK